MNTPKYLGRRTLGTASSGSFSLPPLPPFPPPPFTIRINQGRVKRDNRSVAEQKGWRRGQLDFEGQHWHGLIKAHGKTYNGFAIVYRDRARLFVSSLPDGLRSHPKHPCFVKKRASGKPYDGMYEIHHHQSVSLSDFIVAVESIFTEAITGNYKKSRGLFDFI